MQAAQQWRTMLDAWAIPEAIRLAGPDTDPWSLDVSSFVEHALEVDPAGTSHRIGREGLGDGGTVLDVGCGAGAATVGLGAAVTQAVGVDERQDMLEAFLAVMQERGVPADTHRERWPDAAGRVGPADVVVSHHVAYNVADLGGFLTALDTHARRRVVLEIPDRHPRSWTSPYWEAIHALERPTGPTGADLVAVAREVGLDPNVEGEEQPSDRLQDRERRLDHLMDHLCLHEGDRPTLAEVDASLPTPGPQRILTIWWDTNG